MKIQGSPCSTCQFIFMMDLGNGRIWSLGGFQKKGQEQDAKKMNVRAL
jgi:hypothetical protein